MKRLSINCHMSWRHGMLAFHLNTFDWTTTDACELFRSRVTDGIYLKFKTEQNNAHTKLMRNKTEQQQQQSKLRIPETNSFFSLLLTDAPCTLLQACVLCLSSVKTFHTDVAATDLAVFLFVIWNIGNWYSSSNSNIHFTFAAISFAPVRLGYRRMQAPMHRRDFKVIFSTPRCAFVFT